ncbi:MAG: BamA/TamA family outer membrane protein [Hydrogenophaga sp.]|nr:BamA/TamA family outer membrane protein [Hydrogenophaga sp.]
MPEPSPARYRRAAWRRFAPAILLLCGLHALPAVAQVTAPAPVPDSADEPEPAEPAATRRAARAPVTPRFELAIDAPEPLNELLERHLDIQRFRLQRSLDAAELERLLLELPANARQLLATRGHFSPRLTLAPLQPPGAEALAAAGDGPAPLGRIELKVDPGPATRIASVQVSFKGAVTDDTDAAGQRADIERDVQVIVGQTFTQDGWDRTKSAALRRLTALRYPGGRIVTSLADVDGQDASARLYIELDSGPRQRLGAIEVEGAQRYDATISERIVALTGLEPGTDYDLARLQQAQQRLVDSGYFQSAFVFVEPGDGSAPLPVRVQVREAQRQKLVLGIGGSTDNGARISIEHTHNQMPVLGWRALSTLRLERQDSVLATDWRSPANRDGWSWISLLQAARQEDELVSTTSQRARFGQAQDGEEYDRSIYLQYDRARTITPSQREAGTKGRIESSITANYAWSRERFDDPITPNRGHGLAVELGVGTTLGVDRKPFGRTQARWLGVLPLGDAPRSSTPGLPGPGPKLGRLALRLEGGAVIAREDTPVPDTQLFLTGGDNTVRGYGLRDIGVRQADGSVLAGRYKTVVSLEWQRPVRGDGLTRSPLEHVVFIDGGAVANRVGDLEMQWGVGTGLRYNSPVGPLQVDLAYGLEPRKLRLHLSVGFVF